MHASTRLPVFPAVPAAFQHAMCRPAVNSRTGSAARSAPGRTAHVPLSLLPGCAFSPAMPSCASAVSQLSTATAALKFWNLLTLQASNAASKLMWALFDSCPRTDSNPETSFSIRHPCKIAGCKGDAHVGVLREAVRVFRENVARHAADQRSPAAGQPEPGGVIATLSLSRRRWRQVLTLPARHSGSNIGTVAGTVSMVGTAEVFCKTRQPQWRSAARGRPRCLQSVGMAAAEDLNPARHRQGCSSAGTGAMSSLRAAPSDALAFLFEALH